MGLWGYGVMGLSVYGFMGLLVYGFMGLGFGDWGLRFGVSGCSTWFRF